MKALALLIVINFLLFNTHCQQNLITVDTVDFNRYAGRWFEIASYPAVFQKGCRCSTADYEVIQNKPYIKVTNKCIKFKRGKAKLVTAHGKAYALKGSKNTKLKVQFFWPFRGDYYIIGLANDYSWAVIGHPQRKYLWIISREAFLPSYIYNNIVKAIQEKGYNAELLVRTPQNCDTAE